MENASVGNIVRTKSGVGKVKFVAEDGTVNVEPIYSDYEEDNWGFYENDDWFKIKEIGMVAESEEDYLEECKAEYERALALEEEHKEEIAECDGTAKAQTHYQKASRQPIELMQAIMGAEAFDGFLLGNILKYRLRAGFKGDANKDIEKAAQYAYWRELAQKGVMIDPERDVVPSGFTYEVV